MMSGTAGSGRGIGIGKDTALLDEERMASHRFGFERIEWRLSGGMNVVSEKV